MTQFYGTIQKTITYNVTVEANDREEAQAILSAMSVNHLEPDTESWDEYISGRVEARDDDQR